jgi:hypothetical protein
MFTDFQHRRGPHHANSTLTGISGLANLAKISMLKWKYHCTHPDFAIKIFYLSKPKYHEARRFWYMKLIAHHSKSKLFHRIPNNLGIAK